ncbi:MAG TPA: hypothetical protein VIC53_00205 [Wenzhouxiangella sp.]
MVGTIVWLRCKHLKALARSRLRLPIGVVMRFSNRAEREEAEYRVVAECVSMALP